MEELIAQHNQQAGFDQEQAPRQPNHFEQAARPKQQNRFIQPVTPPRRAQQQDFSPPVPKFQQQPEASAVRKLNHDEALKQNALHRQQLAEVVAKHADRVEEVTKTLNIPDSVEKEQTRSPEPSSEVPRGQKVDRFLAKKPEQVEGAKSVKKSEATSEAKLIDEDYPDQLLDHLELLSKLDKQVEDLFSQALDVFSAEDLGERPAGRRKGGRRKGGRRSQGKQKDSAGKRPKKPRELSE